MRRFLTILLALLTLLAAAGCGSGGAMPNRPDAATAANAPGASPQEIAVAPAPVSGGFAAEFFAAVESDGENKSLSPVSALYALGLMRCGAQGETRDQLDALLRGADFARWNEALNSRGDGPVVEVANSVWFDQTASPAETYIRTVRDDFGAPCESVDLTSADALREINAWVSERTHELIPTILEEPLPEGTAAVLLNALYFNGEWAVPFDAADTYDQVFHDADGAEVPFLHDTRRGLLCFATDECTGAALPYKGDGWYLLVLLPKEGEGAEPLAGSDFGALLKCAEARYVRLALPKFKVEGSYDLTGALQKMGLAGAFRSDRDDFAPMGRGADGPLALSEVIQKTYLRVDERGTEAAAVTGATLEATGLITEQPIELTFDRPFLCCLWNDEIGQPLFLTAVNELG